MDFNYFLKFLIDTARITTLVSHYRAFRDYQTLESRLYVLSVRLFPTMLTRVNSNGCMTSSKFATRFICRRKESRCEAGWQTRAAAASGPIDGASIGISLALLSFDESRSNSLKTRAKNTRFFINYNS